MNKFINIIFGLGIAVAIYYRLTTHDYEIQGFCEFCITLFLILLIFMGIMTTRIDKGV